MNKNLKVDFKRLVKEYSLEDLVELSVLLDEEVKSRVLALNEKLDLNVPSSATPVVAVTPVVAPVVNDVVVEPTTSDVVVEKQVKASKNTKETFIKNCGYENRETQKKYWRTKEMKRICSFDENTKDYDILDTDETGVLRTTVCKVNASLIGGQYGKDGRIWNFIFNPAHELPVFFGPCTKEFLGELKEEILKNIPQGYKPSKEITKRYKSDYGFEGRFYYDELTQDKFIFKTKDGYEGFNDGMAFNVKTSFDYNKNEEVFDAFNILNYNYYFSHNYENAFSPRMKGMHPNMISEVKELMNKVNHKFNTFVYDQDGENTTKDTVAETKNTTPKTEEVTKINIDNNSSKEAQILALLAQNGISIEDFE